jgi:hypothetical protein
MNKCSQNSNILNILKCQHQGPFISFVWLFSFVMAKNVTIPGEIPEKATSSLPVD